MLEKNTVLISFGELFLKSENVKRRFIRQLVSNIKVALNRKNVNYKLFLSRDRLYLKTDNVGTSLDIVRNIPGIAFVSPCYFVEGDLQNVCDFVSKNYKDWIKETETFAIRARRDGTIKQNSIDIAKSVGNVIDRKVNLSNPDREIFVEMRSKGNFIYFETIKGLNGLPVGSSGNLLSLMSGGIDSPVSSYLMLKRGCNLDYVHYHSIPATDDTSKIKSKDLCRLLLKYQPHSKLYSVPFYKIQMEIKLKIEPRYRIVLYRRFMLRIAEELAKKNGSVGLVTGEALSQVSSQTIDNMFVINDSVKIPVLRPLVGFNKDEIISIAKQIESFDISIIPQGDCCTLFTPKHPTTRANLDIVKQLEKKLNVDALIKDAVDNVEVFDFK